MQIKTKFGKLNFPDTETMIEEDHIAAVVGAAGAHIAAFVNEVREAIHILLPAEDRISGWRSLCEQLDELAEGCPCEAWDDPRECMWECRCDCGTELAVSSYDLVTGASTSCGCASAEQARQTESNSPSLAHLN